MGRTKTEAESQTRYLKEEASGTVNLDEKHQSGPPTDVGRRKEGKVDKPYSTLRNSELEEFNQAAIAEGKKRVVKLQPQ